jgi:hypothetical protein
MLMAWQGGDLEETTLSDSDCDAEEEDGNGDPVVVRLGLHPTN